MANRRDFFKTVAGAAAGSYVAGRGSSASAVQAPAARRQVSIARQARARRGHPLARDRARGRSRPGLNTEYAKQGGRPPARSRSRRADRQAGDRHPGAEHQRLLVVRGQGPRRWPTGSSAHRTRDSRSSSSQYPDRFVGMSSSSLQFPDLAAQQLDEGVKKYGLRAAAIGGHVNGEDLSLAKFDPFWAKAAELGVVVFMHPGGAENIIRDGAFRGRGDLGNIIGNPLETTYFLSRLIYDGTLDKFPNLQGVRRARRRVSAVVPGTKRGGVRRPQRRELPEQEEAERVPEVADPDRLDDPVGRRAAPSGERVRARARSSTGRITPELAGNRGPDPQCRLVEQPRQGSDPWRESHKAAQNYNLVKRS